MRLKRAGVPAEHRTARSKPEIALAEVDRLIAAGVRFGCVLADAGYGLSAPFRQGLTARRLAWAVGIPRHLKVYPVGVQLIWPVATRGRPRRRHIPDILSMPAEDMLAEAEWQTVSWRDGTKGKLEARFAAVRVRIADGPPQRIKDKGQQHLPGDEAWLIGEQRTSGEKKYYLANLPAGVTQPGCDHQGAMDLRTGPSAAERGTRPRPLRGTILAKPSPSCSHDDDRLRVPPASASHDGELGKKESMDRHLSQACQPCATPSSTSSCDRFRNAPTADDGSPWHRSLNSICQSSARGSTVAA
jgi:hypothetical protein